MAKANKTRFAILGLLAMAPMSGYDLKRFYDGSLQNFWSESYGQIYPMLKRLAAEGLAESRAEPNPGRPTRHVYSITAKGRRALGQWLEEPAEPERTRSELLLKLFFGNETEPEVLLEQVERYREEQVQALQRYEGIAAMIRKEARNNPAVRFQLMTLSMGRHVRQAQVAWCEETRQALKPLLHDARARKR